MAIKRSTIGLRLLCDQARPPGARMPAAFRTDMKSLLLVAIPTSAFSRRMARSASDRCTNCLGWPADVAARFKGAAGAIDKLNCEDEKFVLTNDLKTRIELLRPQIGRAH